ncbi:MAG: ATP-binding protein [Fusobacterium sp.]|nr:ATP-binding protein [Fusobacterium sp.]
MEDREVSITKQNKLIIAGLLSSTFLIVGIGILTCFNIQNNLKESYQNYGEIVAQTIADSSAKIAQKSELGDFLKTIISDSDNILAIKYVDEAGNLVLSEENKLQDNGKTFSIVTPRKSGGTLTIVFSANVLDKTFSATRFSIFSVFALAWLIFASVILISTYLTTRELRMLKDGVDKITTGEFGYQIERQEVSREVRSLFNAFNEMSGKLHVYEEQNIEQLTLERNKFEAVLMSIANGVVVCDNNDNVVLVNPHAQNLLELDNEQILDSNIQDYIDTEGNFCFREKIQEFNALPIEEREKAPSVFNIQVDKRVIKSIVSPMFTRNHDYLGYIIVLIDITKETEIDTMRSQFISNVSHELRTPVTVLRSYIDTLYNYGEEFDAATQKEFLGTLNQEIIRLNSMVNDILDFSRLDSDYELEMLPNNIVELVETATKQVQILLEQNNIKMVVQKSGEIPNFMFNYNSIQRALTNLLSNAIKYSPENSTITVRLEREDEDVKISVTDEGCGIAPEHLKKLFDRFYRVENATHTIKGTGLGLQLVKTTIEKHHSGKVFVTSEVGVGSTFGFTLPLSAKVAQLN